MITALVVSVHSIVSWDFAAAIVPGWHSTIFAPYFVAGAILSGLAMVLTLMIPGRRLLGITDYVTLDHFEKLARLVLTMSLIVTYSYASEFFFAWYNGEPADRAQYLFRVRGTYAPLFWLSIVCNSLAPLLLFRRSLRRNVAVLFALSLAINVGMWSERLLIIAASLAHEYNGYSWGLYRPTAFEWMILAGSVAWFLFWFLLLIGHLPTGRDRRNQAAHAVERGGDPGVMRVVVHFAAPGDLERAGRAAERAGWRIVGACAPAYSAIVVDTAHAATSPVANAALAGALVGIASGVWLTVGTTLEWPARIIGGKPLIAVPPFLLIVFELAVLGASIASVCSFLNASRAARRAARGACDASTSDNQLSLLLESNAAYALALDDLLRQTTPVSWRMVPG